MIHLWYNFHEDAVSSFYVKLLTDRQCLVKRSLPDLGEGKYVDTLNNFRHFGIYTETHF